MSREKIDSSTFFFFYFHVFESYTLSALICFIALLLGMLLFYFYVDILLLFLVLVSVSQCVKPLWRRVC